MRTILLEDDPNLFRDLECSLLRREDLRILTAGSPEALLESSRRDRPDLVVLRDSGDTFAGPGIVEQIEAIPDSPPCVLTPAKPDREALLARIHEHLDLPARRAPRRRCRLRVRSGGGDDQRMGITRDLSAVGVFVAMDDPFELSRDLRLAFKSHGMRQAVEVGGRVVRSVPPVAGSERLPGMAVRFHDGEGLSQDALDALLRSARATGRPA